MKYITQSNIPYFQGDLMMMRIDALPPTARPANEAAIDGHLILAHSETGHHHVVKERAAQLLIDETNAFILYLQVLEPCEIEHLRAHDTHEAYHLDPGIYELRRDQVEFTPAGWVRAAD